MKRTYILPVLAVLGILVAAAVVFDDSRPPAVEPPPIAPAEAPYASYVAGSGLVEASTGNIVIGSPVSGIVTDMYVEVGEAVDAGQPLFKVDDRDLQAQRLSAAAQVKQAAASLQKPLHQLRYAENLRKSDSAAVSEQRLSELRDDVGIAEAGLGAAKADLARIDAEIGRHTVRAPVAGNILQRRLRLGEYVGSGTGPRLVLGDEKTLYVRVDIDQQDAWRVAPDAQAVAFERGNPELEIPLHFEYVEPLVVPKLALSGIGTERTDTRVLQVVYSFERGDLPVYVGQQMDVYIEAPPATAGSSKRGG
jgi:HlyD family secretion protein